MILDELAAATPAGSQVRKLREQILSFNFCKRLVQAFFKIVGKERRALVSERPVFVRPEGPNGEEASPLPEIEPPMNNGIVDVAKFEPELDRFNKVSVMAGLKFLAARLHTLPDSEAAYVFENL